MSIVLPKFIDLHVHFRTPGQTIKESFSSASKACLSGGYQLVCDMPNNQIPIFSLELLQEKINLSNQYFSDDVSQNLPAIKFHFGTDGKNLNNFQEAYLNPKVAGLKIYLNQTTGDLKISTDHLLKIYQSWSNASKVLGNTQQLSPKPILLHAEEDVMNEINKVLSQINYPTHICHISSKQELISILQAKEKGLNITAGVTPHHLFLSSEDVLRLGSFAMMKPSLKSRQDQEFLWQNLQYIDAIETDHAPHTISEKLSDNPPFGVPGLETTLGLLLLAEHQQKCTLEDIIRLTYSNPLKILGLKSIDYPGTLEVEDVVWRVNDNELKTKCSWSPFAGWLLRGRIK